MITIHDHAKNFWKFASKKEGIYRIEDVFTEWADKVSYISLEDLEKVWGIISSEVNAAFNFLNRTADLNLNLENIKILNELRNIFKSELPEQEDFLKKSPIETEEIGKEIKEEEPMAREKSPSVPLEVKPKREEKIIPSPPEQPNVREELREKHEEIAKEAETPEKKSEDMILLDSLKKFEL